MANEPLDSSTHDTHLSTITDVLQDILIEIRKLRKDVQELTTEVSALERG